MECGLSSHMIDMTMGYQYLTIIFNNIVDCDGHCGHSLLAMFSLDSVLLLSLIELEAAILGQPSIAKKNPGCLVYEMIMTSPACGLMNISPSASERTTKGCGMGPKGGRLFFRRLCRSSTCLWTKKSREEIVS